MTDPNPPRSGDLSADLLSLASSDAATVRTAAFARLREGSAVSPSTLAADTALSLSAVRAALSELVASGTANLDNAEQVVAVGGLSLTRTHHQLDLAGRHFWTWCAFDAIGIPAALGLDATARTRCGNCGKPIEVTMANGDSPPDHPAVGWLPGRECANVQQDFCPEANLFCDEAHLAQWQTDAARPVGRVATLGDLATIGKDVWGEMSWPPLQS